MRSPAFEGEVEIGYSDDTGLLISLEVPESFGAIQHSYLMTNLPARMSEMKAFKEFLKEVKSPATITEIVREVSFEDFWKRYFSGRGSDNSSKKKARTRWERMTKTEQQRAWDYIPKYLNKVPYGVGIKLAETYLNSEVWN